MSTEAGLPESVGNSANTREARDISRDASNIRDSSRSRYSQVENW
jgi:hypothetical protein